MSRAKGNLAVGQSGGPTAVINGSLCGVIQEALVHDEIGEIYGMVHGIRGVLDDRFIDLRRQSARVIEGLRRTPGSALGTARHKVSSNDYERILEVLKARNIRYLCYIGGNDSADTSLQLQKLTSEAGYELHAIAVPKTVDNDLCVTDHCPGYPSAARFTALAIRDTGRDSESMGSYGPIKLLETMGRNAGWLTAAAALAREGKDDAPHLVYVPERPVSEEQLVEDVKRCLGEREHVVIAMSEGARDVSGKTFGEDYVPVDVDAFGHRLKGGVGEYVVALLRAKLGIKVRMDKPNYLHRSMMVCASPVDIEEAYRVGRRAVKEAVSGRMTGMVILVRDPGLKYHCSLQVADLKGIASQEKKLPDDFMNEEGNFPTEAFLSYARPLIGDPLPPYVRLSKQFV